MKKIKKQKIKSRARRKKQLDKFVRALYKEKDEIECIDSEVKKTVEKKEVKRAKNSIVRESAIIKRDLRNVLILTSALAVIVIILFYAEQRMHFLEPLANAWLNNVVK